MMATPSGFEPTVDGIERQAREEGSAGVAELRAMQVRYRMIARLTQRRRELHLTQKQLAARSGIGQAEISKIERGRKSPTLDTFSRLATALDLSSEDIEPPLNAAI